MDNSAPNMAEDMPSQAPARAMDTLHTLPLFMVPVRTAGLRKLKLIKNHHLESVVETFQLRRRGSFQVDIDDLGQLFGWSDNDEHPDLALMRRVGSLPSFDIYSLRHLLRELGHPVDEDPNLALTEERTAELSEYMSVFTRPLVSRIYGRDDVEIRSPKELMALLNHADRSKVLQRLQLMAQELGIAVQDVPAFLESYSDVLLSLAFYKKGLDQLTPIVSEFLRTMQAVTSHPMLRRDPDLMAICSNVEAQVNELTAEIAQRFQSLDRASRETGGKGTRQGFKDLEREVRDHHASISGVLCGLSVKMGIWEDLFAKKETISPAQLADFIKFQMKQGLETMQKVEVKLIEWK